MSGGPPFRARPKPEPGPPGGLSQDRYDALLMIRAQLADDCRALALSVYGAEDPQAVMCELSMIAAECIRGHHAL